MSDSTKEVNLFELCADVRYFIDNVLAEARNGPALSSDEVKSMFEWADFVQKSSQHEYLGEPLVDGVSSADVPASVVERPHKTLLMLLVHNPRQSGSAVTTAVSCYEARVGRCDANARVVRRQRTELRKALMACAGIVASDTESRRRLRGYVKGKIA